MVKVKRECLLIRPEDLKPSSRYLEIIGTLNPGVTRLASGDIVAYVRVIEKLIKTSDKKYFYSPRLVGENRYKLKIDKFKKNLVDQSSDLDFLFKDGTKRLTFISHLRRVILDKTGMKIKSIDDKPSFFGISWDGELGIEDPRITKINNLYIMTYVSLSRISNVSTSYAVSNDGIKWYRRGLIFSEQNKDVVIFPEMVNEEYIAIERPEGSFEFTNPHMWITHSKDMELWGRQNPLNISKKSEWDSGKVGAGPPPIKTEKGWLLFYHGVIEPKKKKTRASIVKRMEISDIFDETDVLYCVGAALLDLKNPNKIISKTKIPLLFPLKKYEVDTFEGKGVIFPTGIVLDESKKNVLLFCGAGDRFTVVKEIELSRIMAKLTPVK
ncbi:4-O-beta-D-mannosyl-D-glucose phosphorylase [uncultured archaeon]|nr:4-O-beta-D-mannosyl-D-glucose phosphorylase [uncultured archaeon]